MSFIYKILVFDLWAGFPALFLWSTQYSATFSLLGKIQYIFSGPLPLQRLQTARESGIVGVSPFALLI
jgi:hypothetical protein